MIESLTSKTAETLFDNASAVFNFVLSKSDSLFVVSFTED